MIPPRKSRKLAWLFAILVVLAAGAIAAMMLHGRSVRDESEEDVWQKLTWRVRLYALKASGSVPDFSWGELWKMSREQGGFGLESVARDGLSFEGALRNPHITQDDFDSGARLFRDHCALCHGGEGAGGHAPALNRLGLKSGDSDLAIYKTLRDGIPNTAMVPVPLDFTERWQVVGYLRTLQQKNAGRGGSEESALNIDVGPEQVIAAGSKTDEWLTYSGSLDGHRFSSLSEITPTNVSQLQLQWVHQFNAGEPRDEATPLVENGVILTTEPPATVVALNAKTGSAIWQYSRNLPPDLPVCCGKVNRGLALLGSTVFWGCFDGYLIAIDANTGSVTWQAKVADPSEGFTMTGAPLIVNRLVVVGVAGGEFGVRGFLAAYDAQTGKQVWKFMTIPGPGELGHETWENDAWKTGGGPTWITGSYDPSLDLLYWGVGNPAPDFSGNVRPGANLFTDSVIALHASTGKLAWFFQFTPHDDHDWDSNQTPILVDLSIDGTKHKVICWANRNGFYYVLDRVTGKFLMGVPFVEQDWTEGLDSEGHPKLAASAQARQLVKPGGGGTNWQNPAYDESKGLVFVLATEGSAIFTRSAHPARGDRGTFLGSMDIQQELHPMVRALDAATGTKKWEYAPKIEKNSGEYSGLLATAGGLVFGTLAGSLFALDSTTGVELWRVSLGGSTQAAPITFTIDGRQVIVVSAGHSTFMFGLGEKPFSTPEVTASDKGL